MSDLFDNLKQPLDMDIGTPKKFSSIVADVGGTPQPPAGGDLALPDEVEQHPEAELEQQEKFSDVVIREGGALQERDILDFIGRQAATLAPTERDAMLERGKAAYELSKYKGIPFHDAYTNLDDYIEQQFGSGVNPKSLGKALKDEFDATMKSIELGNTAGQIVLQKNMKGMLADVGEMFGANLERTVDDTELNEKRKRLASEIAELKMDIVPRGIGENALKILGSTAPWPLYFGATAAVAAIPGVGLGALGLTRSAILAANIASRAPTAVNAFIMTGLSYNEMIDSGVDDEIALRVAPLVGMGSAALDSLFGSEAAIKQLFSAGKANTLAARLSAKMIGTGAGTALARAAASYALDIPMNAATEGAQSVTEGLGLLFAQTATEVLRENDIAIEDPTTFRDIMDNAAMEAYAGAISAAALSVPTSILYGVKYSKDIKRLSDTAATVSKEANREIFKTHEAFEGMDGERVNGIADAAWEAAQVKKYDAEAKIFEAAKNVSEEVTVPVDRAKSGELYMQRTETSDMADHREIEATAHSKAGDEYGSIRYNIYNDRIELLDADFKSAEHQSLIYEMMGQIAAEHPSLPIRLSEDAHNPALIGAYEREVAKNPLGAEMGVQWSKPGGSKELESAKARLRLQLDNAKELIGPAQRETAVAMVEAMADMGGIDAVEAMNNLSVSMDRKGELAAAGKVGMAEIVGKTKAIIHLAEKGNFSTLVHEVSHAMIEFAAPDRKAVLEQHYGVANGKWDTERLEAVANDLMEYIQKDKAPKEELRPIFSRIASWLKKLWQGPLSRAPISEETEAMFDKLFTMERQAFEPAAETTTAVSPAGPGELQKALTARISAEELAVKALESSGDKRAAGLVKRRVLMLTDGRWLSDPQLLAEVRAEAGALTAEDQAVLDTAEAFLEDPEREFLFMGEEEIKGEAREKAYFSSARNFKTFEEFLASILPEGADIDKAAEDIYRQFFEWSHGKERQYAKGEFYKQFRDTDRILQFATDIRDAIYSQEAMTTREGRSRARYVKDAVSKVPELKFLVDEIEKGNTPSRTALRDVYANIKRNESLVKFLQARLEGNQDLAMEAIEDLDRIPTITRVQVLARPRISITEQAALVREFTDKEFREKVKNRTARVKDIDDYASSRKAEAAEQKEAGRAKLKEYQAKIRERDAARRLAAHARNLHNFIMRRPPITVDIEHSRFIQLIQQYLSAGVDGDVLTKELEALGSVVFKRKPEEAARIIRMVQDVSGGNKDWKTWSIGQLEELAERMGELLAKGKAEKKTAQFQFGKRTEYMRERGLSTLRDTKHHKEAGLGSDAEKIEEENKIRGLFYAWHRRDAFFSKYLDGKANGFHYDLLFNQLLIHQREKLRMINMRTADAIEYAKANGIGTFSAGEFIPNMKAENNIRRQVVIDLGDGRTYPTDAMGLLGAYLYVGEDNDFNQSQREALIYGNLFSESDKKTLGSDAMEEKYSGYKEAIQKAARDLLRPEEIEFGNRMLEAFAASSAWDRFAEAMMTMTGKEPKHEKHYFPLFRQMPIADSDTITETLKKIDSGDSGLDFGMSIERKNIQARDQVKIDHDAFRVFFDAIKYQEHLINMGPYAQELIAVYKHPRYSREIQEEIRSSLGNEGLSYVMDHISTVANPYLAEKNSPGNNLLKFFRGSMVVSNLAWRWTSMLSQLITSPLPFISEAPLELASVSVEAWSKGIGINEWIDSIERKSVVLKNRQFDFYVENLRKMPHQGVLGGIRQFGELGMAGIAFADRVSVAIGWEAVFRKKLAEVKPDGSSTSREEARQYADMVVIKTQPSTDPLYSAPVFRDKSITTQMVLQFTQPLNVIWNNIAVDMPMALREKEWQKFIGMAAAYALSGLAIGLIQSLRGRGPEDDEDKGRYWLHAATSQFTDAIPIAGDAATGLTRLLITGKSDFMFGDNNFPVIADFQRMITQAKAYSDSGDSEHMKKAFWYAFQTIGEAGYIPTRAVKDALELFENDD